MNGIYSLLSASKSQQKRLQTSSNNLANVNTPGFKSDRAIFKEHLDTAIGQDLESEEELFANNEHLSPYSNAGQSYVQVDEVVPDFKNGVMQQTGNKLDLALGSEGFFTLQTPQGTRYTRDGKFNLDSQGFLVNKNGDKVLGKKGPIQIKDKDFTVGSEGTIKVENKEIDKIKVVKFDKASKLNKIGNSYFAISSQNQKPIKVEEPMVYSGVIEGSNVDSVKEMVNLITINRSNEAVQKSLQTLDSLDEKSTSLARF